jgi:hypothetical protein
MVAKATLIFCIPALLILSLTSSCNFQPSSKNSEGTESDTKGWTNMLDTNLSRWGTYLSYRHKPGYNGAKPKDEFGKEILPIGYDNDQTKVFSMVKMDGQDVLRVSGEIYGCLFTKQDFSNYHLKLRVKWGEKKYPP